MTKDPTRLGDYKRLVQEERDRKRVNNGLPKIEEKLFKVQIVFAKVNKHLMNGLELEWIVWNQSLKAIEQYEAQHKKSFLVGGVPFKEYWAGQVSSEFLKLSLRAFKNTLSVVEWKARVWAAAWKATEKWF
jgi:hypothetical protein